MNASVKHNLSEMKLTLKLLQANIKWLSEVIYALEEKQMDEEDEKLNKFLSTNQVSI